MAIEILEQKNIPIELISKRDSENRTVQAECENLDIDTLAESIKKYGVITPIIVTKNEDKNNTVFYTLIAGYRRILACKQILKTDIPAQIVNLENTKQADELQSIENVIRSQLHPLDEAIQIQKVLTNNLQGTLPRKAWNQTAEIFGKSVSYCRKHIQLLSLIPELKEKYKKEEFSLGVALVVCREEPEVQKKLLDNCVLDKNDTAESIKKYWIEDYHCDITNAYFDTTECQRCKKCTSTRYSLFDDLSATTCLDRECFRKKEKAYLEEIKKAHIASNGNLKEPLFITDSWHSDNENVLSHSQYSEAEETNTNAVEAFFVDEGKAGKPAYIVLSDSATPKKEKTPEQLEKDRLEHLKEKAEQMFSKKMEKQLENYSKACHGQRFDELIHAVLLSVLVELCNNYYLRSYLAKNFGVDKNEELKTIIERDIKDCKWPDDPGEIDSIKEKWIVRLIMYYLADVDFNRDVLNCPIVDYEGKKTLFAKLCDFAKIDYKTIKTEAFAANGLNLSEVENG